MSDLAADERRQPRVTAFALWTGFCWFLLGLVLIWPVHTDPGPDGKTALCGRAVGAAFHPLDESCASNAATRLSFASFWLVVTGGSSVGYVARAARRRTEPSAA